MATICKTAYAAFSFRYVYGGPVYSGSVTLNDFNINYGVGSNASTMDISILYGGCNNVSNIPTSVASVGRLAIFTCNNFSFTGIVHESSYSVSEGGFIFKCKLIDANKILENVTVLLKDYYCPLQAPNFISIANLIEGPAAVCPPGEDTENWPRTGNCAAFGTSGVDFISPNNGISLLKTFQKLNGQTVYTTVGEPITLNLTDLVGGLGSVKYATVNSTDMSLMQLITTACDYLASDCYVELKGSILKVLLLSRATQPSFGLISSLINTAQTNGTLLRSEIGAQEIYAESNKVIIGDKVTYLSEKAFKNASMMFGYDTNNNIIRAKGRNFKVKINTTPLKESIAFPHEMYEITEEEIVCAGSHYLWLIWGLKKENSNSLSRAVSKFLDILPPNNAQVGDPDDGIWAIWDFLTANVPTDKTSTEWLFKLNKLYKTVAGAAKEEKLIKFRMAYDWFKKFIDEYYGKKWLLEMGKSKSCAFPQNKNAKIIKGDTGEFYLSDVPYDSGYPSPNQANNLRGLIPWVDTDIFETSDNRISGFAETTHNKKDKITIAGKPLEIVCSSDVIASSSSSYYIKNNSIYMGLKADPGYYINPKTGVGEILVTLEDKIPMIPNTNNKEHLNIGLLAMCCLFGIQTYNQLSTTKGKESFVDISTVNLKNINLPTVIFDGKDGCIVPFISNMYVYGPWTGTKGSIGSTKVEVISELNPWNYGGWGTLKAVGSELAKMGLRTSNAQESGSFSLAEPPGYGMSYFIRYGLLLDAVNVNYGANGVTTDYSFKTYSTKFGQYAQALSERVKQVVQIRSKLIENIRNQRRNTLTLIYNVRAELAKLNLNVPNLEIAPQDKPSPGFMLIGGYYYTPKLDSATENPPAGSDFISSDPERKKVCEPGDDTLSESDEKNNDTESLLYEVGLDPKYSISDGSEGDRFLRTAVMSLDGLLSPVSTLGRDDKLSRYSTSWKENEANTKLSKSRPSMPPIMVKDTVAEDVDPVNTSFGINQTYLNPILTKQILLDDWDDRSGSTMKGCNIQFLGFKDSIKYMPLTTNIREQEKDLSFHALRGPLVLQSWGYDTLNKPIPNAVDDPISASKGIFQNHDTKNKFLKNWLQNPMTWPVGPIDLRFDRDRGVWVSPPQDRIVIARLLEDLEPMGKAKAMLINPEGKDGENFYGDYRFYGPKGENLPQDVTVARIIVHDFLNEPLYINSSVYV